MKSHGDRTAGQSDCFAPKNEPGRRTRSLDCHRGFGLRCNRQGCDPRQARTIEEYSAARTGHRPVSIDERMRYTNPFLTVTQGPFERDLRPHL
jgi:hypothetical protein